MRRFVLCVTLLGGIGLWPQSAWAGMPTPQLTEWGTTRLSAISFFAVVVLLAVCWWRPLRVLRDVSEGVPCRASSDAIGGHL
jgi:hypothetical protein